MLDVLKERLGAPTARALAHAVSAAIGDGDLAPGVRLPPIRAVAAELGLSPTTVSSAWALLARSGAIQTDGRRGTVIAPARAPGPGALSPRPRRRPDRIESPRPGSGSVDRGARPGPAARPGRRRWAGCAGRRSPRPTSTSRSCPSWPSCCGPIGRSRPRRSRSPTARWTPSTCSAPSCCASVTGSPSSTLPSRRCSICSRRSGRRSSPSMSTPTGARPDQLAHALAAGARRRDPVAPGPEPDRRRRGRPRRAGELAAVLAGHDAARHRERFGRRGRLDPAGQPRPWLPDRMRAHPQLLQVARPRSAAGRGGGAGLGRTSDRRTPPPRPRLDEPAAAAVAARPAHPARVGRSGRGGPGRVRPPARSGSSASWPRSESTVGRRRRPQCLAPGRRRGDRPDRAGQPRHRRRAGCAVRGPARRWRRTCGSPPGCSAAATTRSPRWPQALAAAAGAAWSAPALSAGRSADRPDSGRLRLP